MGVCVSMVAEKPDNANLHEKNVIYNLMDNKLLLSV